MDVEVLEEHEDDPVVEELTPLINSLSEDEQIDLVAHFLEEGLSMLGYSLRGIRNRAAVIESGRFPARQGRRSACSLLT